MDLEPGERRTASGARRAMARRLSTLAGHLAVGQHAAAGGAEEPMVLSEMQGRVCVVTLSRPKALNALCDQLLQELSVILDACVKDKGCGCIVITGGGRAFAAGADIPELRERTLAGIVAEEFPGAAWSAVAKCKLPTIAAVNGLALGGGCELAMMCDVVIASEKAQFGQPEIKLGVIPGAGGTQRLTKAVGKSKAMELALTGEFFSAADAEKYNLVSNVVAPDELMPAALALAEKIAAMSRPAAMITKEAVLASYEMNLEAGLDFERKIFRTAFGLEDRAEGMDAFLEKRDPVWRHE